VDQWQSRECRQLIKCNLEQSGGRLDVSLYRPAGMKLVGIQPESRDVRTADADRYSFK